MKRTEKMLTRDVLKLFFITAACLIFAGFAWSGQNRKGAPVDSPDQTKEQLSKAAFSEAYKVFMSPRCANCHPAGDVPTQTDAMTLHTQNVVRGAEGKGKYGMKCATCHQLENLEGEHLPPGVSTGWHMPPADMKMVFQGRTAHELCEQFKDPKQNGGKKTLAAAMEHLEADPLVLWGWSPGNGRTVPPLSHEEFMKNIKAWMENGAACPD
jgi:mono/diheme cytochrome c family protein